MFPSRRCPTHPGEILLEDYLKPLGLSQVDFAERLELPLQRVNMIINGRRAVTAETAILLAEELKTTPQFWLNLQQNYDLWHAMHELGRTG